MGPKQVPDNSNSTEWDNPEDFHREGEESHFSYNPDAAKITKQSGDFPQPSDYEPPEKM